MTITKTFHRGFTLPTLLIISTVLMIMGSAVLQGTVSVKNSLDAQLYNQIAREAAEAGIRYGQACLRAGATWSELRPNTTCTGVAPTPPAVAQPDTVVSNDQYRSTFRVQPIDRRADGSTIITARGTTDRLRASSGEPYQTFTETLGEAAMSTVSNVFVDYLTVGTHTTANESMHMFGYDGRVYSVGGNNYGQLGDASPNNRSTPVEFGLPDGIFAKKVVSGGHATFVIGSNDKLYGAGLNTNGRLGDGTTNDTSVRNPVEFIMPGGVGVKDVVTGGGGAGYNTYVLGMDNRLYAAGANNSRQIANTSVAEYPTPVAMSHGQPVKKIAMMNTANNNNSFIALLNDGRVYGIGANSQRQLGGSTANPVTSFSQLALPSGVLGMDIQVGYYNTYVLGSDGNMYGFGRGTIGQLGNGSTAGSQSTAQRFNLNNFGTGLRVMKMEIPGSASNAETGSNSHNSAFVLASNHQVYGAGQNHKGQLGNNTTTTAATHTPVRFDIPSGQTAQDVSSLYFTTCVLTNAKQVYCAGDNSYGQLGIGNTTDTGEPQLFPLPSGVLAQSVKVAYGSVYVIGSDGNIYAAGRNSAGQLGDGTTTDRSTPVVSQRPSVALGRSVKDVSMANAWTSVLVSDGTVWGTGTDNEGQLGGGSTQNSRPLPLQFLLPQGYARDVQAGAYATRVLSSNGQLYGAGANDDGHLGDGTTDRRTTPVRFGLPGTLTVRDYVVSTSAGESVTYVLASDNLVYGAGRNGQGQLGVGNTNQVLTPSAANRFRLPSGVTARRVFFGDGGVINNAFVLGTNGTLYAAGLNTVGQLGVGNTTSPQTCTTTCPVVQMPSGVTAVEVTLGSGGSASYFLGSNGRPYASGNNTWGQLSDGSTTNRHVPTAMNLPAGLTALKITPTTGALAQSVYMLASDGQVYGAGRNSSGQLGRGGQDDFANRTLQPVQLPSGLTAVDFWVGQEGVFILASDGQIYGTGRNDSGQLGVGDTTNRSVPTRFQLPDGVRAVTMASQFGVSATGRYFTGVLGSDGVMYVAGGNGNGQIGSPMTSSITTPRPYVLPQPAVNPGIVF